MSDSAARVRKHRERQKRAEKLKALGFTEGERPSDKIRKQVRGAVTAGLVDVPEEGFDDGSPWRWYPGAGPAFIKGYGERFGFNTAHTEGLATPKE